MKIVADTSFLFSLFGKDGHTSLSREIANQHSQAICTTDFNTLELTNAALQAEFSGYLQEGLGPLIISRFHAEQNSGRLIHKSVDVSKILRRAISLSLAYTLSEGHRTYDTLLVAAALELKATHFLTFDKRQAKLASTEGLIVN